MLSPQTFWAAGPMPEKLGAINFPYAATPVGSKPVEVVGGLFWFRLPLPMQLNHVNAYAARDADGWTIIDTGMDTPETRQIWTGALNGQLSGAPLRRVIVTHHHPDHVGLAGWFQARHGAELWTTRTAWLTARMLTLDLQETPTRETLSFYKSAGMHKQALEERASARPFNFADCVHKIPLGFRRIREGEVIEIGGMRWDVRTGGGHAPEHATFWCRDAPAVLAGDQLLADISPNVGVYPTEPDADPLEEWLESCSRFEEFAQDDQVVLTGHKRPYRGLPERLSQLIFNHHSALERLSSALSQPMTAVECFPALYKRSIGSGEFGLALAESVAHLNHLYHRGQADRRKGNDGAWLWTAANAA